ncbi:unnamed protein product, partial [marine sediment metagenome]
TTGPVIMLDLNPKNWGQGHIKEKIILSIKNINQYTILSFPIKVNTIDMPERR